MQWKATSRGRCPCKRNLDTQRCHAKRILHKANLTDMLRRLHWVLSHNLKSKWFRRMGWMGSYCLLLGTYGVCSHIWQRLDKTALFHPQFLENLLWSQSHLWAWRCHRGMVRGQVLSETRTFRSNFLEGRSWRLWPFTEGKLINFRNKGLAVCRSWWVNLQGSSISGEAWLHR